MFQTNQRLYKLMFRESHFRPVISHDRPIYRLVTIAHRIHGAAIYMVCHGSHQYTPVMLALIWECLKIVNP